MQKFQINLVKMKTVNPVLFPEQSVCFGEKGRMCVKALEKLEYVLICKSLFLFRRKMILSHRRKVSR